MTGRIHRSFVSSHTPNLLSRTLFRAGTTPRPTGGVVVVFTTRIELFTIEIEQQQRLQEDHVETLLGICVGIGLSAACGFRIFVPFMVMSIASRAGYLGLSDGFGWISSTPAMVAFIVATILEIMAYYIPWLDNALDTIAIPVATVAGTIATATQVDWMDPFLKWSLATIGGGGVALTVQGMTSVVRAASAATTGGIGNPVVSTAEAGSSLFMSVLSIVVPFVTFFIVITLILYSLKKLYQWFFQKKNGSGGRRRIIPELSNYLRLG